MKALTNYQTIRNEKGKIAYVVMPYEDFLQIPGAITPGMIPHEVVGKHIMDGMSMLQAWREYLDLTQEDVAEQMGVSQAGYSQIEKAKKPRKETLEKAAAAMGISLEQLAY